jgi:hypothetical protein
MLFIVIALSFVFNNQIQEQLMQKRWACNLPTFTSFIDYEKVARLFWDKLCSIMEEKGYEIHLIK